MKPITLPFNPKDPQALMLAEPDDFFRWGRWLQRAPSGHIIGTTDLGNGKFRCRLLPQPETTPEAS